jgi:hypothetical protein|tara:strand:- start:1658 stop:2386 length:729 start_codon:yes stop_codon:yes gene_type:complete
MAAYTSFQNTLPDPNNAIGTGGQESGTNGEGFASITFSSNDATQVSRTNSGRVITRTSGSHMWGIQIKYNPMTREQFEPIYSFLLQKGRLTPFFIQLPNHYATRNAAFNTYTNSNTPATTASYNQGGEFMVQSGFSTDAANSPQPGDMFTVVDTNDSLHTKAYRVTRVMSNDNYHSGLHSNPTTAQRIVYFTPRLARPVGSGMGIDYNKPKIRVMLKTDVQQYSLGTNNLYQFSLNLEEAQA